ncbi:hypothetical protein [Streptomyces tsukubensis]|uniref:Uncharacterized protein n=1 Tax=Streptomyces tsukubensis TaxID=83656 RepID=A0A1V4ABH4_9ACTN|nr:hypothetical protein [Streptomyces tsukubensis]OON80631.1 hypothetical protein B1H18_12225 [Streptomyces tsukubensis]QFR96291.1 hypothetical protein GBW32_28715 [Streptomyces tsukubensis]
MSAVDDLPNAVPDNWLGAIRPGGGGARGGNTPTRRTPGTSATRGQGAEPAIPSASTNAEPTAGRRAALSPASSSEPAALPDATAGDAARAGTTEPPAGSATAFIPLERELRAVLPPHDGTARDCVIRLDALRRYFHGSALATRDDIVVGSPRPELELAMAVGGVWRPVRGPISDVVRQVRRLGPGAMAFVLTKPPGGEPHGIALRNHGGIPLWLETQAPPGSRVRTVPPPLVDARVLLVAPTGRAVAPDAGRFGSVDGLLHPHTGSGYGWHFTRAPGNGGRAGSSVSAPSAPLGSIFSSPGQALRAKGQDGQPITVVLRDIVCRAMPGTGHGVAFTRDDSFQLTGRHHIAIKTLPGETAHDAGGRTRRPAPRLRLDGDFHVHAEGERGGFVVPLRDGTRAVLEPREFATVLSRIERLRTLAHTKPDLNVVLLSSGDHDAKGAARELFRAGINVTVLSNDGTVSQLPDGSFGVAGNRGWSTYQPGPRLWDWWKPRHRRLGVHSDGNINNITFFETHLPTATYIPDADPGAEVPLQGRDKRGDVTDFFPHEVVRAGLTSTSTGRERTNGLDLTADHEELLPDMAGDLDRMTHVIRTFPGEKPGALRRVEWDGLRAHDPHRRLVEVPWQPVELAVTDPRTGQRGTVRVGPNVIVAHGHSRAVRITIERGGNESHLSISGDTLMGLLVQLPEFQRMYADNPHSPFLLLICGTAEDGAPVLEGAVQAARYLSLPNTFIGAGSDIVLYKQTSGPLLSVMDNAGFTISSRVHGHEVKKTHARYPAAPSAGDTGLGKHSYRDHR